MDELNNAVNNTIKSVEGLEKESERVIIRTQSGTLIFEHHQDCCEYVRLLDYECDADLVGAMIISAEEANSDNAPDPEDPHDESGTWTFYRINTTKGEIFMRWLGESNGYYSEAVDATWVPEDT